MLGMVAGASFPVRSWGLLLPWHLFLELPREFLLSGICCSTSGSTEGAIGDRLFRTQEADAVHISMWVACRAPYTSVHLVCLRQPQCERLERVAPQKPLVSGGHIIRVPSIYLSQSFPNVPLRIGKIYMFPNILWSVMQRAQFSSVAQLCLTLCDPMDCSTPGLPVHHQLPEPTQTHVHRVIDAIQPSHPLSSPSPPAFNLSHHQDLFQRVSSSHQVAKILELQLQHQSFQ